MTVTAEMSTWPPNVADRVFGVEVIPTAETYQAKVEQPPRVITIEVDSFTCATRVVDAPKPVSFVD